MSCFLSLHVAQAGVPPKYFDVEGQRPVGPEPRFAPSLIRDGEFVRRKRAETRACHRQHQLFWAAPLSIANDPIETFLNGPITTRNLAELERQGLTRGAAARRPWSGDYWPYAAGLLGARFMDLDFAALEDWKPRYDYVLKNPTSQILAQKGQDGVRSLSVAEKYDLIAGDANENLTKMMWKQGQAYFDHDGRVEDWMGLCHGWAPAAIVEPRPVHAIEVPTEGQKWQVHLNPAEIKGLLSYAWATNPVESRMLGQRCNLKNPPKDQNGRILDPACRDLNPATWHLILSEVLGRKRQSFVMDATYDYEVWNQPLLAYFVRYFDVRTGKLVNSLDEAVVNRSDFPGDSFRPYRAPTARQLVGIALKLGYVVETSADLEDRNSPDDDAVRWVDYRYDLELDEKGEIVGGEWHTEQHPDFIWQPLAVPQALSPLDPSLAGQKWSEGPLPDLWARAAQVSSPYGIILKTIVDELASRAAVEN